TGQATLLGPRPAHDVLRSLAADPDVSHDDAAAGRGAAASPKRTGGHDLRESHRARSDTGSSPKKRTARKTVLVSLGRRMSVGHGYDSACVSVGAPLPCPEHIP